MSNLSDKNVQSNKDITEDITSTITTTTTKDPIDFIADRFRDLKTAQIGKESYPTAKDYEAIAQIVARGMPLPQTIKLLEQCFSEYRLSNPNGNIYSFGYCQKYIEDKYDAILAREKAKKGAKKNERPTSNIKQSDRDELDKLSL